MLALKYHNYISVGYAPTYTVSKEIKDNLGISVREEYVFLFKEHAQRPIVRLHDKKIDSKKVDSVFQENKYLA